MIFAGLLGLATKACCTKIRAIAVPIFRRAGSLFLNPSSSQGFRILPVAGLIPRGTHDVSFC